MISFVTDYLQKLSSAATPPEGRPVNVMDDLVSRELNYRVFDESKYPPSASRPGLISRLFPNLAYLDQEEFISNLNVQHRNIRRQSAAGVAASSSNPPATSYNLRPRAKLTKEKGGEGSKARKEKAKDDEADGDGGVLYDISEREWNEAASNGVALVNKEFIEQVKEVVANSSSHTSSDNDNPGRQPAHLASDPKNFAIRQSEGGSSKRSLRSASRRCPGFSNEKDVEEVETDSSSSSGLLSGRPRRGAAYDGDSSRDKDFFEGNEHGKGSTTPTMESRRAAFMNLLSAALMACDPDQSTSSRARRLWYGTFSTKELAPEDGEPRWSRKPDLLLLDRASEDYDTVTWRSPKAIGEMTSSRLQDNKTLIKSLNTKAYILLSSQPWRRHVLALSFAASELRIHYFDRSGAQVSAPINWHRRVKEVCKIIHAFACGTKSVLGFDPTLRLQFYPSIPRSLRPPCIGTVIVDDVEYDIISILWASNGFIGRGTVCFHVRKRGAPQRKGTGMDEYDLVLKDSWVAKELVDHERSILEHLAGTEGVPSLIKAWIVRVGEQVDDTLRYRPEGWVPPIDLKFILRVHRRLLMTPVGSPFSTFRSQQELLNGLIQGLEIHERLVAKGILHRDISPNNMVFACGPELIRRLLLIDFDCAVWLNQSVQYPQGTGTLPFASLTILRRAANGNADVRHEVADDLEFFFYVFIWICVSFAGPNQPLQTPPNVDNGLIFHAWGEGALAPGGLKDIMNSKSTFIHSPNFMIEEQFTPYFSNLKDLAKKWRSLVKDEDIRRTRPESLPNSSELTHQRVIKLLRDFMSILQSRKAALPSPYEIADSSSALALKRQCPPSPSSPPKILAKRRRNNSSGSIGTVWLPSR